jgi:hypothetical protein
MGNLQEEAAILPLRATIGVIMKARLGEAVIESSELLEN